MKIHFALIIGVLFLLFVNDSARAQGKAKTQIESVRRVDNKILVNLTADKPFLTGDKRYYLYIGNNIYFLNRQSADDGKGQMTFYLPADEFLALPEGSGMYLTCGKIFKKEAVEDRDGACRHSSACWQLGKFSKSLLKK